MLVQIAMHSGSSPAIYNISGDRDGDAGSSMATPETVDSNDSRNVFGFATNYHETQNVMRVHADTSDVVRDEANALHRVTTDAARAECSAHLAETVRRLDEESSRKSLEMQEQFMESRAFFHAQVNQMRGAISAEVDNAVAQRSEQHEQIH